MKKSCALRCDYETLRNELSVLEQQIEKNNTRGNIFSWMVMALCAIICFFGVADYTVSLIAFSDTAMSTTTTMDNRLLRTLTYYDMLWFIVFLHYAITQKPKPRSLRALFIFTQLVVLLDQQAYWLPLHWFYKCLIGVRVACVLFLQNLYHLYLRNQSLHVVRIYERKRQSLVAVWKKMQRKSAQKKQSGATRQSKNTLKV